MEGDIVTEITWKRETFVNVGLRRSIDPARGRVYAPFQLYARLKSRARPLQNCSWITFKSVENGLASSKCNIRIPQRWVHGYFGATASNLLQNADLPWAWKWIPPLSYRIRNHFKRFNSLNLHMRSRSGRFNTINSVRFQTKMLETRSNPSLLSPNNSQLQRPSP